VIPSRVLILLSLGPLGLAVAAWFDRSLGSWFWAVDGALLALAALDAWLARRPMIHVVRRCPEVLSLGRKNLVSLEVRSTATIRLDVSIAQDLFDHATSAELPLTVSVEPRGRQTVSYRVVPGRRGAFEIGDHTVRYRSPLGLWIRQLRIAERSPVKVYPDIQAIRAYDLVARSDRTLAGNRLSRRKGGESEFERLRDYRVDDEYRAIDWKGTARHNRLIAREYQLEQDQSVMFMLDAGRLMTAEAEGLSLFDHALNATLMLTHVATRAGDRAGLMTFSHEVKSFLAPTAGAHATANMIRTVYHLYPELTETRFRCAFETLSVRLKKRALVAVVTQLIDDVAAAELLKIVHAISARHLTLLILLRDTGIDDMVAGKTAETEPGVEGGHYVRAAAAELLLFRDRVIREIERRGALVLDVGPGELTPALINRYLEIKARHLL
jgi:uncharacterized protein (DUF58 family)